MGSPIHIYRLGLESTESSSRGNTLGVLVGEQLNMTQQCALAAQRMQMPFWDAPGQQAKGGDSPSLLCSVRPHL